SQPGLYRCDFGNRGGSGNAVVRQMQYLIPAIILLTVAVGAARRVNVYNCFLQGTKNGLSLCVTLFPYIATMFVLINFMEVSGVGDVLSKWIAPLLSWTGIPVELARLVVIRPF